MNMFSTLNLEGGVQLFCLSCHRPRLLRARAGAGRLLASVTVPGVLVCSLAGLGRSQSCPAAQTGPHQGHTAGPSGGQAGKEPLTGQQAGPQISVCQ